MCVVLYLYFFSIGPHISSIMNRKNVKFQVGKYWCKSIDKVRSTLKNKAYSEAS